MSVGKNIRYYREQLGLTQEQLAKRAGYISRSNIARFEKIADEHITKRNLERLASALNVSVFDLLGYEATTSTNANIEMGKTLANVSNDERLKRLIGYYNGLTDDKKETFMDMFELTKQVIDSK